MFNTLKKTRGLYLIRIKRYNAYKILFVKCKSIKAWLRAVSYLTPRSVIPDSAQCHTISSKKIPPKPDYVQYDTARYCAESSSAQYDSAQSGNNIWGESSAQYDTAWSLTLLSIKLHIVTLYILRGVNGHFLKLVHRPLKGQCHKNNNSDYAKKGLHFSLLHQCSRITFSFTPSGMILRGVSFFSTLKSEYPGKNKTKFKIKFKPLVSNRGWFEWWKN